MDAAVQVEPPRAPAGPRGLDRDSYVFLALIVGVALVRVAWVAGVRQTLDFPDEKQYLNIADTFLRNGVLAVSADSRTNEMLHYPLEMHRPPVYPLILALMTRCGLTPDGMRLVQAVVGALTCAMVYFLARELAGEWPGRIAGLLAAVDPFAIRFSGLLLSETFFLLFFVTSWYYVARAWKETHSGATPTRWIASCMLAGLLAALATLTRSEALGVYALVPAVWLLVGPARLKGLAACALFAFVLAVGLSPWVARNYMRTWDDEAKTGRFVLTTCNVGESLYEAVGPFADGGPNKDETLWPPSTDLLLHDECARDRLLLRTSIDYMAATPRRVLRLAGVKFLRTWNILPNYPGERTTRNLWVSAAFTVPVYLAALVGLAVMLRRRELAWVLLPVLVWTLVHMVFVGSVRYRLPMMPLMFVLDGAGVAWLVSLARRRRGGAAAAEKGPA